MSSIARILDERNKTMGLGFLVSKHHVITCAHVVSQTLDIEITEEVPARSLPLDFALVGSHKPYVAHVTHWFPPRLEGPEIATEDIAFLELDHLPAADVQPVHLTTSELVEGHEVQVFGFPRGFDNGIWQSGKLVGKLASGWLQMETLSALGPGFSGSPVWDMKLNSVVGMVVAFAQGFNAVFVIPSSILESMLTKAMLPDRSLEKSNSDIRVKRIQADNVVSGSQIQKEDAQQIADLIHAAQVIRHGEVSADEVAATNVVSGLQYISSLQYNKKDEVTAQITRGALIGNDLSGPARVEASGKGDVLVIEPGVVTKLPRDAAYERIVAAADSTRKQIESIYDQTRNQADQWSRLSLIAAVLGFLIVVGGIVAMFIGNTPAGIITAAAGVIPEVAAALFFQQMGEANNRVDAIREKLYEAEGTYRAIEFSLTTDEETQGRLKETIILRMLDISTRAPRAISEQQTPPGGKTKSSKKSAD
jgi:hypothetical protein